MNKCYMCDREKADATDIAGYKICDACFGKYYILAFAIHKEIDC